MVMGLQPPPIKLYRLSLPVNWFDPIECYIRMRMYFIGVLNLCGRNKYIRLGRNSRLGNIGVLNILRVPIADPFIKTEANVVDGQLLILTGT